MPYSRNNQNYTRIKVALALSDDHVSEIMSLVDAYTSKAKANAWSRGKHSGRVVEMSDRDFDRFCAGLVVWGKRFRQAANDTNLKDTDA